MKNALLEFLYGTSQTRGEIDDVLDSDFSHILEQAAETEDELATQNKAPLVDALKSVGITAGELIEENGYFCFITDDNTEYIQACRALNDPENMHKLAEKGWVAEKSGDQAMSNEKPEFKIKFLEITVAETDDKDKGGDEEEILKKAQKFASTEMDRDDPMNPVEHPKKEMGDNRTGVGEPSDGKNPEGKIKDSLEPKALVARLLDDCGQPGSRLHKPGEGQKPSFAKKPKKRK